MVNPSLAYEILMYLNSFYFGLYACVEMGMSVLKAVNQPYARGALATEAGVLVALLLVETIRLVLGRRGNLASHSIPVCLSIILTAPSAMGVTYFLLFQTRTLRLEYILCGLMLMLHASEIFFALLFLFTMCRPPSYD